MRFRLVHEYRPSEPRQSAELKATDRKVVESAFKMGIPPRAEINTADEA